MDESYVCSPCNSSVHAGLHIFHLPQSLWKDCYLGNSMNPSISANLFLANLSFNEALWILWTVFGNFSSDFTVCNCKKLACNDFIPRARVALCFLPLTTPASQEANSQIPLHLASIAHWHPFRSSLAFLEANAHQWFDTLNMMQKYAKRFGRASILVSIHYFSADTQNEELPRTIHATFLDQGLVLWWVFVGSTRCNSPRRSKSFLADSVAQHHLQGLK
jgi:hypothetical protein